MTLSYPLNFLDIFPGWDTEFEIMRRQELSRVSGGRTYVKDLGSPLWHAVYQTKTLSPNNLDAWRARLDALEDGLQTFRGRRMGRMYPIAYPNGSWPTGSSFSGSGTIATISSDRKALSVSGFPAGFAFKVGDMIQVGASDLHRVMEDRSAGQFEIRPHLWPGVAAGAAVKVLNPSCLMAVIPGTIMSTADAATGRGRLVFEALEAR